jgi:ATP-dependent DNA ligase
LPTAIYAELLVETPYHTVKQRTLDDPNWVWQEKHNGDRRLVTKNGSTIEDFNRKGEPAKGLPPNILKALQQHPLHKFIIDCEYVQAESRLYVFDILIAGDDVVALSPYSSRLSYIHSHFDGFHADVLAIESAITREEKLALYEHLRAIKAEGFAAKELKAPYRQSNATGTLRFNFKVKFWKDLDAVVICDSTERNKDGNIKDAVRLGVYTRDGRLQEICGSTKKSRYDLKPFDVVTIKYLYGTGEKDANGRLILDAAGNPIPKDVVQPSIVELRTDKTAKECTIDQIQVNKNWRKR